jgi:hypothetical protein
MAVGKRILITMTGLVCIVLVATGCTSFTTIMAAQSAAQAYRRLYPAGEAAIVATHPLQDGAMLVLTANAEGERNQIELFRIDRQGGVQVAAGKGAGSRDFSVSRLAEGDRVVLFGVFAHGRLPEGSLRYHKAVMISADWKRSEAVITGEEGFILVLEGGSRIESFALYSPEGHPAGELDRYNRIHETAFVPLEERPTPALLADEDIAQWVIGGDGQPDLEQNCLALLDVYNRLFETLTPNSGPAKHPPAVILLLRDGQQVQFDPHPGGALITYRKGEKWRSFSLASPELHDILRQLLLAVSHEPQDG